MERPKDMSALYTALSKEAWKEQRIKDLAAAIHGYVALKGAEPLLVEDELDLVGNWISELKTLWESM